MKKKKKWPVGRNAKTSVACIVSVVRVCCCRVNYWSGVMAQKWGWSTGCRGWATKTSVGAWLGQFGSVKRQSIRNKKHLFLTEEKEEAKTSPLCNGAESLQTYLSRPCWCRFLLDQALLLIQLGRLTPSLWCWQGQASRTWSFVK